MGRVHQRLGGAKPPMMILLGARKPLIKSPCMETFKNLNTLACASNHCAGRAVL